MNLRRVNVDVAIVGAGLAGLWLGRELERRGLSIAICEGRGIGGIQSIASQGIIHGGLKYALSASRRSENAAPRGLADMPARWRSLDDVPLTSAHFHLWAIGRGSASLTGVIAKAALAETTSRLARADYPPAFRGATGAGVLYRLDEPVVDVPALIRQIAAPLAKRILPLAVQPEMLIRDSGDQLNAIVDTECGVTIDAQRFVFSAGAGNPELTGEPGQLRPLTQVVVQHPNPMPIFAHCMAGPKREPDLTITTHGDVYYVGGRIATRGADPEGRVHDELCRFLPWHDWRNVAISTFTVDRAEAANGGRLPDSPRVIARGNTVVCWPTKLCLVPAMVDEALEQIVPLSPRPDPWPGDSASPVRFAAPPF